MSFTDYELGIFPVKAKRRELADLSGLSFFHNPPKNKPVLLLTGGIAPLHEGHIAMLLAAEHAFKKEMSRLKIDYSTPIKCIVPGHDSYLKEKTPNNFLSIQQRIMIAEQVLKSSPRVEDKDNWFIGGESMFFSSEVNFTTIHEVYKKNFGNNVWIVFGSDNARFASNYAHTGKCIVVKRPGYELEWEKWRHDPRIQNPNVLFIEDEEVPDLSSTKLRYTSVYTPKELPTKLLLRKTSPLGDEVLFDSLLEIFQDYFEVEVVDAYEDAKALDVPLNSIILDRIIGSTKTVSFGPFRNGRPSRLPVSRSFKPGGYAQRADSHLFDFHIDTYMPSIAASYPDGVYLVDDDIATGGTMARVEELCKEYSIPVLGRIVARNSQIAYQGYEILDSGDFYFRSSLSGLVIGDSFQDPELLLYRDGIYRSRRRVTHHRYHYTYPFVCPTARASIPPKYAIEFSKRIITMNIRYLGYVPSRSEAYLRFLEASL